MQKIKKHFIKFFLIIISLNLSLMSLGSLAKADSNSFFNMDARSAYAIDAETGQVLYEKNAQKTYPIASVVKIVTLGVIEQDIRDHKLSWNQKITISPEIAKMSTDSRLSNVELIAGAKYTVRQLVESMMLVSADGSTQALAIASAGSTAAFNKKMKKFVKDAGVTDEKIYNAIGLPNSYMGSYKLKGVDNNAENKFSAKDVALISKYLVDKYPETTKITSKKFAKFGPTAEAEQQIVNINSLLPQNGTAPTGWNIDGLKTGNTDDAGKCIVTTGTYNGHRVVVVALHTVDDWAQQGLMLKKFYEDLSAKYDPVTLGSTKELPRKFQKRHVAHAKKHHSTRLELVKPVTLWIPKGSNWKQNHPKFKPDKQHRSIMGFLEAPFEKGDKVGYIRFNPSGMPSVKVPVKAISTIKKALF
ncbi:MAG: serine hydrolase [Limosilactobacillus sp.]|uniref:D-alanyl-D-alanine carboxypeptidase family protein n=1 Tax=Limosilactobacillus sp. TaxID=2773925 RepID=UPI002706983C|nr:serine hydrolase [Limosilactobacillus sp.]